jgi:hypothetical protein
MNKKIGLFILFAVIQISCANVADTTSSQADNSFNNIQSNESTPKQVIDKSPTQISESDKLIIYIDEKVN